MGDIQPENNGRPRVNRVTRPVKAPKPAPRAEQEHPEAEPKKSGRKVTFGIIGAIILFWIALLGATVYFGYYRDIFGIFGRNDSFEADEAVEVYDGDSESHGASGSLFGSDDDYVTPVDSVEVVDETTSSSPREFSFDGTVGEYPVEMVVRFSDDWKAIDGKYRYTRMGDNWINLEMNVNYAGDELWFENFNGTSGGTFYPTIEINDRSIYIHGTFITDKGKTYEFEVVNLSPPREIL